MNQIRRVSFCVAVFILIFPSLGHAQFDTATVLGTVTDSTKLPIGGSTVTLTSVETGVSQTSLTNEFGDYEFVNVRIGRYKVSAEQPGFKQGRIDEFTVTVNARQRVNIELQVGNVEEVVTVQEAAIQLETDNSSRGTIVSNQQIVDLPLNGRSYADLTLLAPGIRKSDLAYLSTPRDASFNVNGMRSSQDNFMSTAWITISTERHIRVSPIRSFNWLPTRRRNSASRQAATAQNTAAPAAPSSM